MAWPVAVVATVIPSALALMPERRRPFRRASLLRKIRTRWIEEKLGDPADHRFIDLELGYPGAPARRTNPADLTGCMSHGMLITGEPGSGKSTMLLRLLRHLLDQAAADAEAPIPVLFSLASWSGKHRRLDAWLAERLAAEYGLDQETAQDLVEAEHILPLLDGLDEVPVQHQAGCVRAVNAFQATHKRPPLAITSRPIDYQALTARLEVPVVLSIQPLSRSQVDDYLGVVGGPALAAHPGLRELLRTPLMLSLAARTFPDVTAAQAAIGDGSLSDRQDHLIGGFVRQVLRPEPGRSAADGERVLTYLARTLALREEQTFHIELLRRSWLPRSGRLVVAVATALPAAVLAAGAAYLAVAPIIGAAAALWVAPAVGAVFGITTLSIDNDLHPPFKEYPFRTPLGMIGLWLPMSLIVAFVGGLFGGLIGAFARLVQHQPAESIDFTHARAGAMAGLLLAMLPAVLGDQDRSRRDLADLPPGGGFAAEIRLSGQVALAVGLPVTALLGYAAGAHGTLIGILVACIASYLASGRRLVANWCVRAVLVRRRLVPRRPLVFLSQAVTSRVLVQTGGGYAFAHRLLLEHFARRELSLPTGYRLRGIPVSDLRPAAILDTTLQLVTVGKGDAALVALRYASFLMPPREFGAAAFRIASAMEPSAPLEPAAVDRFIAAHQQVIDTAEPALAARSTFRLAVFLATASHRNPHIEQEWRDAARRYFQLAAAHPDHAAEATRRLATTSFTVAPSRFIEWEAWLQEQRNQATPIQAF